MVAHDKAQAREETNTTRTVTRDDPHAVRKVIIHTLDQETHHTNTACIQT